MDSNPIKSQLQEYIYSTVHAKVQENGIGTGCCVLAAGITAKLLFKRGHKAIIQAGTAQWPRIHPHQDDGVSPTHFGYVWEPDSPRNKLIQSLGYLPELHAWCAILPSHEIIDMTTGLVAENCLKMIGADWPGPKLPPYIWATPQDLPDRVIYHPHLEPTELVSKLIIDMIKDGTI